VKADAAQGAQVNEMNLRFPSLIASILFVLKGTRYVYGSEPLVSHDKDVSAEDLWTFQLPAVVCWGQTDMKDPIILKKIARRLSEPLDPFHSLYNKYTEDDEFTTMSEVKRYLSESKEHTAGMAKLLSWTVITGGPFVGNWSNIPLTNPLEDFDLKEVKMGRLHNDLQARIANEFLSKGPCFDCNHAILGLMTIDYEGKENWDRLFNYPWVLDNYKEVLSDEQDFLKSARKFIKKMKTTFAKDPAASRYFVIQMLLEKGPIYEYSSFVWLSLLTTELTQGSASHGQLKTLAAIFQVQGIFAAAKESKLSYENLLYKVMFIIDEQILRARKLDDLDGRLRAWKMEIWNKAHRVEQSLQIALSVLSSRKFDIYPMVADSIPQIAQLAKELEASFTVDANKMFIMPIPNLKTIEKKPWGKLFTYAFIKLYRDGQFPISIGPAQRSILRTCLNYTTDSFQESTNSPDIFGLHCNLYKPICSAIHVWRAHHFFGSNHLFQLSNYRIKD